MDKADFSGLNLAIQNQANIAGNIMSGLERQQQENLRMIERANKEIREQRAKDSRNLEVLAENSVETVESLKEMNQTLKESNQFLRQQNNILTEKISDIGSILLQLIQVTEENAEEHEDMMKQALALSVEISRSLDDSNKFDWKGMISDMGVSGVFMVLQALLHGKGLL